MTKIKMVRTPDAKEYMIKGAVFSMTGDMYLITDILQQGVSEFDIFVDTNNGVKLFCKLLNVIEIQYDFLEEEESND